MDDISWENVAYISKAGGTAWVMMMQLLLVELVEAEEHRLEPHAATRH